MSEQVTVYWQRVKYYATGAEYARYYPSATARACAGILLSPYAEILQEWLGVGEDLPESMAGNPLEVPREALP